MKVELLERKSSTFGKRKFNRIFIRPFPYVYAMVIWGGYLSVKFTSDVGFEELHRSFYLQFLGRRGNKDGLSFGERRDVVLVVCDGCLSL